MYENEVTIEGLNVFMGFISTIMFIVALISIFLIVCQWKVFTKAGKPGWAAIVPIYNNVVFLEVAKLPVWQIIFFFIPFANIYILFKMNIELAHRFGKSTGFGLGLVFLNIIFLPMLAFGDAKYEDAVQNNGYYQQPMNQNMNYQQPMNQNNAYYQQPMNQNMNYQQPMNQNMNYQQPMNQNMNYQQPMNQNVAFCSNCGSQLAPNVVFCPNCGKQR